MNLISVHNLSRTAGDRTLFKNASFGVDEGDHIAVVGVNGSGKSTLLRILAGSDTPDTGEVMRNRSLRIGFLEQSSVFNPDDTILDHILRSDSRIVSLIHDYEKVCYEMERTYDERLQEEHDGLVARMDELDAWKYESDVRSILHELGIRDLGLRMGDLSGGMVKKVALARCLVEDSNLLILDEPTNHLDPRSILWLEKYLQKMDRSLLLVTHDRYFLDSVVTRILEIDREGILMVEGNYEKYLEKKAEIEESLAREEKKAKSFLRTEMEWLKRQPKARGTKQKARIDRIVDVQNRKIDTRSRDLEFSVAGRRLGKRILEARSVGKSFDGRTIISGFEKLFKGNERIGIVGPNGSGKSTLLNLLAGRLEPDQGEIVRGVNTAIGYFDQMGTDLPSEMRILEFIQKNAGHNITLSDGSKISAQDMLERFLFPSSLQYLPIGKLSGGERRRLQLVRILMQNPNFLILDEPTNDLDIFTLSILEEFLDSFPGCVTVVSHDRYFLDRVAETLLVLDGSGEVKEFIGSFSDYLDYAAAQEGEAEEEIRRGKRSAAAVKKEKSDAAADEQERKPKKLSFKEIREMESLETEIMELEEEKSTLESRISSGKSGFESMKKDTERLAWIEEALPAKTARWEDLARRAT